MSDLIRLRCLCKICGYADQHYEGLANGSGQVAQYVVFQMMSISEWSCRQCGKFEITLKENSK